MSKLLKFKKLITIYEAAELLESLINEPIDISNIYDLTAKGYLIAYGHKYMKLVEVKKTPDQFYEIIDNDTGLYLTKLPSLDFTYFHLEHGKIYILTSKNDNKTYALVDEDGIFIEDCKESNIEKILYINKDIYELAALANSEELPKDKHGMQEIPVEVINQKTFKYIDGISLLHSYKHEKEIFSENKQNPLNDKVSYNTVVMIVGLVLELLQNKEDKKYQTQEVVKQDILENYPNIYKVSDTSISLVFAGAKKELKKLKQELKEKQLQIEQVSK